MSLIDFVKDAGEKLFGSGKAKAAMTQAAAAPTDPAAVKAANDAAGDAILEYIKAQGLSATGLTVTYDGATTTASVFGVAPDQATKEKIVLCAGNVSGVSKVNDNMSVDQSQPEATYYTVVAGDNRICKLPFRYFSAKASSAARRSRKGWSTRAFARSSASRSNKM